MLEPLFSVRFEFGICFQFSKKCYEFLIAGWLVLFDHHYKMSTLLHNLLHDGCLCANGVNRNNTISNVEQFKQLRDLSNLAILVVNGQLCENQSLATSIAFISIGTRPPFTFERAALSSFPSIAM